MFKNIHQIYKYTTPKFSIQVAATAANSIDTPPFYEATTFATLASNNANSADTQMVKGICPIYDTSTSAYSAPALITTNSFDTYPINDTTTPVFSTPASYMGIFQVTPFHAITPSTSTISPFPDLNGSSEITVCDAAQKSGQFTQSD